MSVSTFRSFYLLSDEAMDVSAQLQRNNKGGVVFLDDASCISRGNDCAAYVATVMELCCRFKEKKRACLHELGDFVEAPVPVTLVVGLIIHTVVNTVHRLQFQAHRQLPRVLRH